MSKLSVTDIITYATYAVTASAAAAAVLPQGKPGSAWFVVRNVIDALAINLGNASNAKKP